MELFPLALLLGAWATSALICYWFFKRVQRRTRQALKTQMIDACLDAIDECQDDRLKRKGNNFGDQMFRATLKGQEDAFRAMVEILNSI